jgi:signal transduction histidine kinase
VQLQQAFVNLLDNAVTSMSGTVNGSAILSIESRCEDRMIQGAVRDTGSGIPFTDTEEAFRPLELIDRRSTRRPAVGLQERWPRHHVSRRTSRELIVP